MEVIILNDYAEITGGSSSVALQSAIGLAALGVRVTVFTAVGPVTAMLQNRTNLDVICLGQHSIADDPNRMRSSLQGI
jgi:hypothetical protein